MNKEGKYRMDEKKIEKLAEEDKNKMDDEEKG